MNTILGIDPGECTGWGLLINGVLIDCGKIVVAQDQPLSLPRGAGASVWIEKPTYRPHEQIDPNKIMTLAIKVGRLQETYLALGNRVRLITPNDWKGTVPKQIQNERDMRKLTYAEIKMVHSRLQSIPKGEHNNVWDGIGIALWAGRSERGT